MMRMLIVGYCFGIRSERRAVRGGPPHLAYRWFCRLGLDADVPDQSTFSKNRHGRFRQSDLLRKLFETVVEPKMSSCWRPPPKICGNWRNSSPSGADLRRMRRRAQIVRPDCRRNRYSLS